MPSLKPGAGILTNITPDHLDRHGTMENYAGVKARMFAKQGKGDRAIIGVDDEWCATIAATLKGEMEKMPVSVLRPLIDGVSAPDGVLRHFERGKEIASIDLRSMPALKGVHNWQNACMAYGAAQAFGLSTAEIEAGMRSFPGLVHRMQEIGRIGALPFINDSKATNADAAAKALASFDTIYWIAGGIAKAGGITSLTEYFPRIVKAYLIGQAAEEFSKTLSGNAPVEMCGTLDRAVAAAARDAVQQKKPGAVVLLSPACASFDHYPNFEVRGEAFVRAVAGLAGVTMAKDGGNHAHQS
jgi:UDP-N-acetylmuramoylalanine--D-glutamate ligase